MKIGIIFISLTDIINKGELENPTTSLNDVSQENATGSCWNTTKYIFVGFLCFCQLPTGGWTSVFKQTGENTMSSGDTITSFLRGKEWKVSFEFQPTYLGSDRSILRFSSPTPPPHYNLDFQITRTYKLRLSFPNPPTQHDFPNTPSMGKWSWTKLEYKQEKKEEKEDKKEGNSRYFVTISMNDKIIYKAENTSPKEKSNTNVILGSQPGKIRSLLIENKDIEME